MAHPRSNSSNSLWFAMPASVHFAGSANKEICLKLWQEITLALSPFDVAGTLEYTARNQRTSFKLMLFLASAPKPPWRLLRCLWKNHQTKRQHEPLDTGEQLSSAQNPLTFGSTSMFHLPFCPPPPIKRTVDPI